MTYSNFISFVESVVRPRKTANPDHFRLDGNNSGGNRESAGEFQHHDKLWKVHSDTHYEPLLLAYDLMTKKMIDDPFVEKSTSTGKRTCLVLCDKVQRLLSKPRFKYLYIYEV